MAREDYLNYLEKEIAQMSTLLNPARKVGATALGRRLAHIS